MIDEELKKSSEEQGTEETNAGKTAEQEAPAAEDVKDTETKDSDAKDAGEAESAEQGATPETSDAETEKLKKKYEDALAEQKDKSQNFDFGAREVIEKLLPVVDNFERALGTVDPEDEDDAFTKGVRSIYKQLEKMFEDLDVKAIPAEGEKFDPNLHNAVMTDTESDAEEDTITQDLLKGYTYKGQVVRHSMVKVKK